MATFHEIETTDADEPWDGQGLPPGVLRALVGFAALLVVVAIPYFAPGLERFRAWVPGDPIPFSKHFQTGNVGPQVAEASGGAGATVGLGESERAALAATEALEDDAAPLDAPALVVVTPPTPKPGTPEAPAAAPDVELPQEPPPEPQVKVPPETWAGVEVLIEDPKGAMASFYSALRNTALQKPGAITRIAHWGDSAIGADGMTSVTRRLLQRQLGDSGHGFILIESGSDWYKHKDIRYGQAAWKALKIIDDGLRDGRYGYGGVQSRGYLGANAWFETMDEGPVGRAFGRAEIWYQAAPKHGDLQVKVDGGEPTILSTAADEVSDEIHVVKMPDGPHKVAVRVTGGGPVRLYGMVLERDRPGVVYDSMGLVGARGQRLLNADPAHWKRQLELRRPDLMILMYGGNELVDRGMNMDRYRETFSELVGRFRTARPEAACLVMSPLDHGERHRGGIRSDPMLLKMMPIQRAVAFEHGCAFYSVFDAMGGEGSMGRWFRSEPRLGWGDLAHPTKEGARVLGDRFYRAVMKGFAGWLEAQ